MVFFLLDVDPDSGKHCLPWFQLRFSPPHNGPLLAQNFCGLEYDRLLQNVSEKDLMAPWHGLLLNGWVERKGQGACDSTMVT